MRSTTTYSIFWSGRTAFIKRAAPYYLCALIKVHSIEDGLITFTVLKHEGPDQAGPGRLDKAFYEPGLTFTVPFSGEQTVLRTLDDEQKLSLAELKPIVKVGESFGSVQTRTV